MTSGSRLPTWKERENNKRRERRRRAVAAKIYAGLRAFGTYRLPKHCDNNEVLKALCNEAGWTVEPDGTTYRKGCKPPDPATETCPSNAISPCSSHPTSSYPSPASSSNPSPPRAYPGELPFLLPWLKSSRNSGGTASSSVCSRSLTSPSMSYRGSVSAPVTPAPGSPKGLMPRVVPDWDALSRAERQVPDCAATALANAKPQHPSLLAAPSSACLTQPVLMRETKDLQKPGIAPSRVRGFPACMAVFPVAFPIAGLHIDVPADTWRDGSSDALLTTAFHPEGGEAHKSVQGSMSKALQQAMKPWEGEIIHECPELAPDELELTLGSSKERNPGRDNPTCSEPLILFAA